MKCPQCKKVLKLEPYVIGNVDAYGQPVLAKAQCCGLPVMVYPIRKIEVEVYDGHRTADDWGDEFKKAKD